MRPEMRCEEHAVRAAAAAYQDAKGFEAGLLERRRAVVAVQRLVSPKEGIHSGHGDAASWPVMPLRRPRPGRRQLPIVAQIPRHLVQGINE